MNLEDQAKIIDFLLAEDFTKAIMEGAELSPEVSSDRVREFIAALNDHCHDLISNKEILK
jgi:hypothetical protein